MPGLKTCQPNNLIVAELIKFIFQEVNMSVFFCQSFGTFLASVCKNYVNLTSRCMDSRRTITDSQNIVHA